MSRPRIDATVTGDIYKAVEMIAKEIDLSNSAVVNDAIGLYLIMYSEAKKGRRVALFNPDTNQTVMLSSPILSSIEFAALNKAPVE